MSSEVAGEAHWGKGQGGPQEAAAAVMGPERGWEITVSGAPFVSGLRDPLQLTYNRVGLRTQAASPNPRVGLQLEPRTEKAMV